VTATCCVGRFRWRFRKVSASCSSKFCSTLALATQKATRSVLCSSRRYNRTHALSCRRGPYRKSEVNGGPAAVEDWGTRKGKFKPVSFQKFAPQQTALPDSRGAQSHFPGFKADEMHVLGELDGLLLRNVALNCTEAAVSACLLMGTNEGALGISERLLYIVSCTSNAAYLWCDPHACCGCAA
jgi:hypothetical protein